MKQSIVLLFLVLSKMIFAQISFENQATPRGLSVTSGNITFGGGVSFFDYNNDGWDDITIATENGESLKVYQNLQDGFFIPEANLSIPNLSRQKQPVWVDIDNDGDYDLFLSSDNQGNRLYKNESNQLIDITVAAGLPTENLFTHGASWGDYNNDSFLDLFISNRDPIQQIPNFLFKNNGDGTFTNVSIAAGIGAGSHLSFCATFFDYDNDGWQDIYVANDKTSTQNLLYHNNQDGTFTEMGESSLTNIAIDAMSTTIGDYNNDGWFDIYVTNGIDGNYFFRNNQDGTFSNIAMQTGTTFNSAAWGALFLDAENDGDLDLYVSSEFDGSNPNLLSAALYENQSPNVFSILDNGSFSNDTNESYANAIGDIDNDGFPEILVSNSNNENIDLWKNSTNPLNNWLKVKLQGTQSNRQGIGSTIEIKLGNDRQYRYTLCGEGYMGQNSAYEFIGLKGNTIIDYVKVTWLSGMQDIFYNVQANQALTIIEGTSPLSIDVFNNQEPNIYPNPVTDYLNIDSISTPFSYKLYDASGRLICGATTSLSNKKIDVGHIKAGVYVLTISTNGISTTKQIIKL